MRLRLIFAAVVLLGLASLSATAQQPQWGRWGHPQTPRAGACFYQDAGFNGAYFCMRAGDRWPSMPHGFNDQISSVRLFGGAVVQVFENGGYGGRHARINRDIDTLARMRLPGDPAKSWNDRISAIAVFNPRDDWDRGHPGN